MAETAAIAEMARKMSEELFNVFGWRQSDGPIDVNWDCVTQLHSKKTHPTDVVYWYDDPYNDYRVYINIDLKSYGADSITKTTTSAAIKNLGLTTVCANVAPGWREKYADSAVNYEVVGLLFIYNHDSNYDKNFPEKLNEVEEPNFTLPQRRRMYVMGPEDISFLATVANDVLRKRGQKKVPDQEDCKFFYPDLIQVRARSQAGDAASLEMLTGPFQILKYAHPTEGPDNYLFYYRGKGDSTDEFMYIIDYFFRYQLLSEKAKIQLLLPFGVQDSPATFRRAANDYVDRLHGLAQIRDRLAQVTCTTVTKVVERWSEAQLGMRLV